ALQAGDGDRAAGEGPSAASRSASAPPRARAARASKGEQGPLDLRELLDRDIVVRCTRRGIGNVDVLEARDLVVLEEHDQVALLGPLQVAALEVVEVVPTVLVEDA